MKSILGLSLSVLLMPIPATHPGEKSCPPDRENQMTPPPKIEL